jgi:hypothetical protein
MLKFSYLVKNYHSLQFLVILFVRQTLFVLLCYNIDLHQTIQQQIVVYY